MYETIEHALEIGAMYAGVDKKVFDGVKPETETIAWPHYKNIEVYNIKNSKGVDVKIGVGKFREGFDLWLIDPKTGYALRK